jgi:hypothetical protein
MDGIDKLSRIPPNIRRRIVALNESGLNNCKVHDTLIREDRQCIVHLHELCQ